MDMMTLAMAKPKVIDLGKYGDQSYHGLSIEAILLYMARMSLQAGGSMMSKKVVLKDSKFRDDLSTNKQVVIRQSVDGNEYAHIHYNTAASCVYEGKAEFYSVAGMLPDSGSVLDIKANFAFISDTEVAVYVQVTAPTVTSVNMPDDF